MWGFSREVRYERDSIQGLKGVACAALVDSIILRPPGYPHKKVLVKHRGWQYTLDQPWKDRRAI